MIGEEYDLLHLASPFHDEIQNKVGEIVSEYCSRVSEHITVLELGFGTGISSKVILESNERIQLFAVDNAEHMLEKAKVRLVSFDTAKYNLEIADALDFIKKYPDNSVDIVASVWVLHNINTIHRNEILKEIYRVLKPKGVFINADKIADSNKVAHDADLAWQIKQFDVFEKIGKPELKNEWINHYYEDEDPMRILTDSDFQTILKDIGFIDYVTRFHYKMDRVIEVKKR